jgi:guanylate kinase
MSSNKDGIMVILSSPSGAGKTTLVKLLAEKKNFNISISYTTRKLRANEVKDQDYYYVDNNEFEKLIKDKAFLEYAKVFNHLYGTVEDTVIKKLKNKKNVIFDIDWQGADQIKNRKLNYKLITFFVLPPSKQVLFNRLSNRDMKDKLIAEERMKEFSRDVLHWINYDYVVINDNLDKCYKQISDLIDSETNDTNNNYDREFIRKHVEMLTS